jgi:hypothetical protein
VTHHPTAPVDICRLRVGDTVDMPRVVRGAEDEPVAVVSAMPCCSAPVQAVATFLPRSCCGRNYQLQPLTYTVRFRRLS